jgi:hypothetical protein
VACGVAINNCQNCAQKTINDFISCVNCSDLFYFKSSTCITCE